MSGYTSQAIVHHGILDKDIAFIGKPFTPDALVTEVIRVLQEDVSSSQPLEKQMPDTSLKESVGEKAESLGEPVSRAAR